MFRKYVIATLALLIYVGSTACTSKKADEKGGDIEASAADEAIEEADANPNNSDLENKSASAAPNSPAGDLGIDELAPDDKSAAPPANAGEITATNEPPAPTPDAGAAPAELNPTDAAAAPVGTDSSPPPLDAAGAPTSPDAPPPAVPEPMPAEESKPVAASGSLQKIKTQPYKQGKTLVNAVYIARQGDTVEKISQKVYGTPDHVKDICKINSVNCARSVKVGDKYYYNSPQRPTDDASLKVFYEDAGMAPETYTAKAGDNIRAVAKQLLGSDRSWMEVWATNEVESKGALDEGTQLKYWPKSDVAAPAMAKTEEAKPADAAAPPVPDQAANTPPPPPPPDQAQAAAPPPPPQDQLPPPPPPTAAATNAEPPPPPPPPPPPADNKAPKDATAEAGAVGGDPDQTMMLGVGAVLLLAAAALFISIRKKRQRRQIDFNTSTQTQIE